MSFNRLAMKCLEELEQQRVYVHGAFWSTVSQMQHRKELERFQEQEKNV